MNGLELFGHNVAVENFLPLAVETDATLRYASDYASIMSPLSGLLALNSLCFQSCVGVVGFFTLFHFWQVWVGDEEVILV